MLSTRERQFRLDGADRHEDAIFEEMFAEMYKGDVFFDIGAHIFITAV